MAKPEDTLIIETTKGPVTVEMRPHLAPNHVARIKELARQGFYDGIIFHRVIDGFMAQTGDPTGTGRGGSDLPDLDAEFNIMPHGRGSGGMAGVDAANEAPHGDPQPYPTYILQASIASDHKPQKFPAPVTAAAVPAP